MLKRKTVDFDTAAPPTRPTPATLPVVWIDLRRRGTEAAPGRLDAARNVLRDTLFATGLEIETVDGSSDACRRLEGEPVAGVLLLGDPRDEPTRSAVGALLERSPTVPVLGVTEAWSEDLATAWIALGAQDLLDLRDLEPRRLLHGLRTAAARQRRYAAREERSRRALDGAGDGLWDWDVETDEAFFSARWKTLVEPEATEVGQPDSECVPIAIWLDRIHPDDRAGFDAALHRHLAGDSDRFDCDHRLRIGASKTVSTDAAAETYRWFSARGRALRDDQGRAVRITGSLRDISVHKEAEAQLLHDAFHDALTGLPNSALFTDRLRQALRRRHRRPEDGFALFYFDLDRFKRVNDSLGHAVGDRLLEEIARRLRDNLRPGDTVARLGGDEFGLLVHDVADAGDAVPIAARIQELLARKLTVDRHELYVSASIGIALAGASSKYTHPEEMLRDADLALYRAKSGGGSGYEIFDREMHRHARALLQLETELRQAVGRKDFVMHYQPIVSIENGGLVGFEALMRWCHPLRGLVPPREFLGVAEATGLIVPLGWWVLEEACRQMAEWQQCFPSDPPLAVSANVSGQLFLEPEVVERLAYLLEIAQLPPESLWLEITERVLLDHGEEVLARLAQIRALGVQLHLDDFGTGTSSLSHLQRFRCDSLKIDPSYIQRLDGEEDARGLVRTLVTLGRQLKMNVIAEGVETAGQFRRLKELHCPEGQGHWFARPMDPASAEVLIRQQVGG